MEFVKKPAPKGRPIPSGWQRTVDHATGDHFYVSAASGRVVYKFDDMFKGVSNKEKQLLAKLSLRSLLSP
jgi:hypothetical protein